MKISTDIKVLKLKYPFKTARRPDRSETESLIVTIEKDGYKGYGEIRPSEYYFGEDFEVSKTVLNSAGSIIGDDPFQLEDIINEHAILFFFTPLIAAMAGNVGVQSSAIIVQGIANDDIKGSIASRLSKEMLLALFNGIILAVLLFTSTWLWKGHLLSALAISLSLIVVIIMAGLIGTFIPLFLNKRGIDPAVATGPFITTSNDIFGILIYFWMAKIILGI